MCMVGLFSYPNVAASSSADVLVAHSELLARWLHCTQAGNKAYDGQRWACSMGWHTQALWLAESLCNGQALQGHPHECLASLVVSHHNLADVHWARGDTAAAVSQWLRVRDALQPVLKSAYLPSAAQHTVHRYLKVTQAVINHWQSGQPVGSCPPLGCMGCGAAAAELLDPADPHRMPAARMKQ